MSPEPTLPPRSQSRARWWTLTFASCILATLVGLILYASAINQNHPPVLKVELGSALRVVDGEFYVPFQVVNRGGESAEAIQIMAELRLEGGSAETGEQQVDSLSAGESIQGSFVFSHDPSQGDLVLRVASYRSPQALLSPALAKAIEPIEPTEDLP